MIEISQLPYDKKLEALTIEDAKDKRNLEVVYRERLSKLLEPILKIVEGLGFEESEAMRKVREEFQSLKYVTSDQITRFITPYQELGEAIVLEQKTKKSFLALNILFVAFYASRQTVLVQECFNEAFEDALDVAYGEDQATYDLLNEFPNE